jgi:PAS domain S-box-containing protein
MLLIEDDKDAVMRISAFLDDLGYAYDEINHCTCLQHAKTLDTKDIDVILADLTLPDSACEETFKNLQEAFPYIPVIVLSTVSEINIALATLQQGAQDYLVKGAFNAKELDTAIRYAMERKKRDNDYKRLFEDSPSPMYIYDEKTFDFLAVNKAALYQFEYNREEFLSMNACEIRPAEDVDDFCKASGEVPEYYFDFGKWRHIKKNGTVFFVHIYAHRTEFEGKDAIVIMAINIDKKVKTEMALEEKTSQLTTVIESITDGFFAINKDWNITYVNKECEKIFKQSRKGLLGKNVWTLFPRGCNVKFYSEYLKAMNEKVSVNLEEYDSANDTWISVNGYPTKEGLAVYLRDITQEKKTQEKIFNDEQNLRAIINNTKDIIWSIDKNNNIISANQAFWDRVMKISGKNVDDLKKEDFENNLFATWNQYFEKAFAGEAYKVIWMEQRDGDQVYEEISFNPIINKQSEVIGISCFSRDITEEQLHVKKIEQQNEQLKKIALVQSHEVRRPLANILGLIHVLDFKNVVIDTPMIMQNLKESALQLDNTIRKITVYSHADNSGNLSTNSTFFHKKSRARNLEINPASTGLLAKESLS